MDKNQFSRDHHMINHFSEILDSISKIDIGTRSKSRLSIPGPSPEKRMAESLKN